MKPTPTNAKLSGTRLCVLAAALVGLSGATFAQSSVTVFSLIDLNLSQYSSGSKANAGTLRVMNDGTVNGLNGSRLGFRGTEDLGGGLRAGFLMEQGVLVDTGNLGQGGRAYGRQVFVSLSKTGAGEVRLGRQYILSDSVVGQGNPFGNALVNNPTTSVTNMGRNLPMFLNAPRADNAITYQSPNWGGFGLGAMVAAGEAGSDRFHGMRATYGGGPLYVGVVYEFNKSRSTGDTTNKSLSVSANYNLGFVKLVGGLQRNSDLTTTSGNGAAVGVSNLIVTGATSFTLKDLNGLTVGAEVPVGGATVLGINYTRVDYKGTTGASNDLGKFAFTARYGFSKNTFLYGGLSQATGGLKEYISQVRVVQAGMRTAF
jgi:general bacterial porin, GBP family